MTGKITEYYSSQKGSPKLIDPFHGNLENIQLLCLSITGVGFCLAVLKSILLTNELVSVTRFYIGTTNY